jgi:hypothetical protein
MGCTVSNELGVTAVHEGGPVAASYFLQVPFTYVTIVEEEGAAGPMHHGPASATTAERIDVASYSGCGGFVDATTCRWVEQRVIVALAGGLAAQRAMGLSATEVGSGVEELTDEQAGAIEAKHGGKPDD